MEQAPTGPDGGELPLPERADLLSILRILPDGLIVVDGDGDIAFANPTAMRLLGVDHESLVGHPLGHLVGDDTHTTEIEVRTADRGYRVLRVSAMPVQWQGGTCTLLSMSDVTEPREREEDLRRSEERYALAITGARDGLWDWDLVTGTLHVSERWRHLLGLDAVPEEDHDPGFWFDRCHSSDLTHVLDALEHHFSGAVPTFSAEHRLRTADGSYVWVLARGRAVFDEHGHPTRIAGSLTDIEARKVLEERLVHEARHDPLTGLANRRLLLESINESLAARRRNHRPIAVAVLDLDGFKAVNDEHGHEAGDALLVEVAHRLRGQIRPGDLAARLGGDEFALLLDEVDQSMVQRIAARIGDALERPYVLDSVTVTIGASMGVAIASDGETVHELLRRADRLMYDEKRRLAH